MISFSRYFFDGDPCGRVEEPLHNYVRFPVCFITALHAILATKMTVFFAATAQDAAGLFCHSREAKVL